MRIKSHLLIIFFAAVGSLTLFNACNNDDDEDTRVRVPDEDTKSTFIMLFHGNNNLSKYLVANVNKTLSGMTVDFPTDARVFLFFDSSSAFGDGVDDSTSVLFEFIPPSNSRETAVLERIESYGEQDSTDPEFIKSVLNKIKTLSPSEEYGIILSSHGTGWFPIGAGVNAQSMPSPNGREFNLGWEHDFSKPESGEYVTRLYGQDGTNFMEISDVVEALSVIDFDYIIFDACFMSSVEVLYDLRHSADYVVASPAEIMGYGFPFDTFVTKLFGDAPLATRLTNVAKNFYEFYDEGIEVASSASVAVVETAKMEALAAGVKGIFDSQTKSFDVSTVQGLESMSTHAFYDLKSYMEAVSDDAGALSGFYTALDNAIIYSAHTSTIYSGYGGWFNAPDVCGISSYIPRDIFPINKSYYYETAWAKATQPSAGR